ncbi:MAG: MarR family winged helix-turn-helix transcriptional regulator [Monoglobales bacterium]
MDNYINNQIDIINQKIKEMNALYHIAAGKSGIADGEVCIWSALLNSDEKYTQQDLCEMFSLSKQTVNSLISGMVKKGFVLLEHMPGTRNRKMIRLSDEGIAYGKSRVMWIFEAEQKAMEETEPQEVQACISMLEKYIANLKREFSDE